jgi:hypothetical protein
LGHEQTSVDALEILAACFRVPDAKLPRKLRVLVTLAARSGEPLLMHE